MRTSPHRFLAESPAGLVAFSDRRLFRILPGAEEVFEEMYILRGEVLAAALSGNSKHAEHFIPIWDDWTHRLQVGVFLRGAISPRTGA